MNRFQWLLVAGAALAGCAQAQTDSADQAALSSPVRVSARDAPASGDSRVTFTIAGGFATPRAETMSIAQPLLELRAADGRATLAALRLPLGDIDVPPEALPPRGLSLRDLVLTAPPAPARVLHAEADALELALALPLELDWSLRLSDGSSYPLGPVQTGPIDVDVRVFRAGGVARATVDARCSGTCWAIAGVAQLSDGAVHLEADAQVTTAP